jgi:Protein of unknown function (DUF2442)
MPTGAVRRNNKSIAGNHATGLRFQNGRLVIVLKDDREVSLPLSKYPTLQKATPAQRRNWEIIGPGDGFDWPDLDLQLCVDAMVLGIPEGIPKPPDFPELGLYADDKPTRRTRKKKSA